MRLPLREGETISFQRVCDTVLYRLEEERNGLFFFINGQHVVADADQGRMVCLTDDITFSTHDPTSTAKMDRHVQQELASFSDANARDLVKGRQSP